MNNITLKYLPSAERDLTWGLAASCVGFQRVEHGEPYPPKIHPDSYSFNPEKGRVLTEYQLIYIIKGRGHFASEHCSGLTIQAGDMILLFPGERHTYYPDRSTGWEEYWIGFQGANIDSRVENGFFRVEKPVFHVGMSEHIIHTYRMAINTVQQMGHGYQQMLAGCTNMLLGFLCSLEGTANSGYNAAIVQRALQHISEHYKEDIHPEDVAAAVNCGYSLFRKIFLEHTGISPYQHILRMRIERSKELLAYSDKPLSEIAYDVGFNNSLYFSTAFKRAEGLSPKQFRLKVKG